MDKLKKKKETTGKTATGKRWCLYSDVNVHVMYNLSHVETERTYTPLVEILKENPVIIALFPKNKFTITVIGVIKMPFLGSRAQDQGLQFEQTKSHAIILNDPVSEASTSTDSRLHDPRHTEKQLAIAAPTTTATATIHSS